MNLMMLQGETMRRSLKNDDDDVLRHPRPDPDRQAQQDLRWAIPREVPGRVDADPRHLRRPLRPQEDPPPADSA